MHDSTSNLKSAATLFVDDNNIYKTIISEADIAAMQMWMGWIILA